jgi:hypothetical protein
VCNSSRRSASVSIRAECKSPRYGTRRSFLLDGQCCCLSHHDSSSTDRLAVRLKSDLGSKTATPLLRLTPSRRRFHSQAWPLRLHRIGVCVLGLLSDSCSMRSCAPPPGTLRLLSATSCRRPRASSS